MDLSRAEAVADLIASESVAQHRMALTQMRGGYSEEFITLRERLLKLTSLMELELDFSEEDVAFADRTELLSLLDDILGKIERLTSSFRLGNVIKKGIPVAIVGSTNAGKSTLLNALLLEERAIVSDTHGTTRDTIEETLNIDGLLFRFIDTAGLRSTADNIEALGIERSYRKMDEAALVLLLLDASRLNEASQQEALQQVCTCLGDKPLLVLLNKIDLLGEQAMSCEDLIRPLLPEGAELLPISAKQDQGLGELRQALVASLALPEYTSADLIVSNARHYTLLKETSVALNRVRQGLVEGLSTDLVTPDLRHAIAFLGEVTGTAITSDQVLHHIFAHFCIGK
jgi:ferrous iron transport protein B